MAARRALILGCLALAPVALAACQVPQRVPPLVVVAFAGPPSHDAFQSIVAIVRAHGYEVQAPDLARGTFRVASRYSDRGVAPGSHSITVQLYANGHAQLTASGLRVQPSGDGYVMPPALRREIVALAQLLER